MIAIIKTGGKQYLVSPGKKLKIEKVEGKNDEVVFNEVLLLEKDGKTEIGSPLVKNAFVSAKILKQGKADKIIVFKFKNKTRHKTKKGHRQQFTEVEVNKIEISK